MRRCLGKCEGLGEGEIMEKPAPAGTKRKIRLEEFQLKTRRFDVVPPENSASPTNSENSTCESVGLEHVEASCCSSNGSSGHAKRTLKLVDLEEVEMLPEFSATSADEYSSDCRKRRETTPSSEVHAESGELESTIGPCESKSYRCDMERSTVPSEAELEEFFSVAETNLQKQFIEKYNYDIVKDQPLAGRYDWVQILKESSHDDEETLNNSVIPS